MKYHIVWNENKTEGFITNDAQLAYEVRKSATTNCYKKDGTRADVAIAFCDVWGDGDCTKQEIDI